MQASNILKNPDYTYINGQFLPQDKALIDCRDRGFRFGDAVFETIRVENSIPYRFELHLKRLKKGLRLLGIKFATDELKTTCEKLIKQNKQTTGFIRISISRGVGSNGYLPIKNIIPTIVIESIVSTSNLPKNVNLWCSNLQKPSIKSLPVNIKTAQGLNSVLAKIEANKHKCYDAILLNEQEQLTECSASNIFFVKNDRIYTPNISCGLLEGITREVIINKLKLEIIEGNYGLSDLLEADEMFITNSNILALPVTAIKPLNHKFNSAAKTKLIQELIHKDIDKYCK